MSSQSSPIILRVPRLFSSGTTRFNWRRGNRWFRRNHVRLVAVALALYAFILLT